MVMAEAFCAVDDLRRNGSVTKWVDAFRDEITAVWTGGGVRAMSTVCPHFGGEMEVDRAKSELRCKWHGWRFDLESGGCLTFPLKNPLRRYHAEERAGQLWISRAD